MKTKYKFRELSGEGKLFVNNIFSSFNQKKIGYVVLRGYEQLPNAISNDIDLGIVKRDKNISLDQIYKAANNSNFKLIQFKEKYNFLQLIFTSNAIIDVIKIDIWTELDYKGLRFAHLEKIINNFIEYRGIKIAKPLHELEVTLTKELLHNGILKKDKFSLFREKLKNVDINITQSCLISHISNMIQEILKTRSYQSLNSNKLIRLFFFFYLKKNVFNTIILFSKYLFYQIKFSISKKGKFIVFIGPDGSGKTTISEYLLDKSFFIETIYKKKKYFHGRYSFLPDLKVFLKRNNNIFKDEKYDFTLKINDHLKKNKIGKLRTNIYLLYYLFDFLLGNFFLFFVRRTNTILIADRFWYDFFIQKYYLKHFKIFKFLYKNLLSKPDYLFFLKSNPEVIKSRKNELSFEEIKYQQQSIEKLIIQNYLCENVYIISSSEEIENTIKKVLDLIF